MDGKCNNEDDKSNVIAIAILEEGKNDDVMVIETHRIMNEDDAWHHEHEMRYWHPMLKRLKTWFPKWSPQMFLVFMAGIMAFEVSYLCTWLGYGFWLVVWQYNSGMMDSEHFRYCAIRLLSLGLYGAIMVPFFVPSFLGQNWNCDDATPFIMFGMIIFYIFNSSLLFGVFSMDDGSVASGSNATSCHS